MIQLYSDKEYLTDKGIKVVKNNDVEFDIHVAPKDLDAEDRRLMKEVEGIEILDDNTGLCRGRYGVLDLENISTGLKTLLNIRYYLKKGHTDITVDVTNAGQNVLQFIFDSIDNTNLKVILRHCNILNLPNHDILLNDSETYHTTKDLYIRLSQMYGEHS